MASTAGPSRAAQTPSLDNSEYLETRSVQLEWRVGNLKQLFDQTKGESKSRCVKSALFDNSRWQLFLYPNSGHDNYVSLYLSCEPTQVEKERALAEPPAVGAAEGGVGAKEGKEKDRVPWRRDGKFKFTFEARSIDRRIVFKQLEADNHDFSFRTKNWGFLNFWRRSEAYYNNPNTRASDAFLIVCTIVCEPTLPTSPPLPHLLVPKTLINAYASMFDDPDYADVVFRIRPEGVEGKKGREKRLYAAKKVLAGRSEYFDMMLSSGFHESTRTAAAAPSASTFEELEDEGELDYDSTTDDEVDLDEDDNSGSESTESEQEDDSVMASPRRHDSSPAQPIPSTSSYSAPRNLDATDQAPSSPELARTPMPSAPRRPISPASPVSISDDERRNRADGDRSADSSSETDGASSDGHLVGRPATPAGEAGSRFVDAPSAPQSPVRPATARAPASAVSLVQKMGAMAVVGAKKREKRKKAPADDRPRFEVVVTDAAYSTYRALLHYLYTDSISFSPLASTYYVAKDYAATNSLPFPYASRRAYLLALSPPSMSGIASSNESNAVAPCSAKAIYRLSDKMGLVELKERAFEHIVSSLNAQNIVYEVFGSFVSRFDEVRRVEVAFLLEKWNEVRSSPQMRKVFDYVRTARFPGFEDVWLEIVQNLEVRIPPPVAQVPTASSVAGGGAGSGAGEEERV
ncbi:hypothetical protein Rt10032_c18g6015 [Rhodotorula toruloides]|uniref:MATH domain-containing protein n=1 Tax=Rhodotorula toruloides TaxID=5286 RepID=A0A511KNP0_RHOTO|nr:hypothetical protein Rt10032_c18g6015 [Rhodotorula toruloides]